MADVYPVFDLVFKISSTGKVPTGETTALIPIKEMESFSASIDGNVQQWSPMEQKGWVRSLMTGKQFTISLSGKRHEGDPGNDYVAGLSFKTGTDCSTTAAIEFPDGASLVWDCVVDVKAPFGGESTEVSALNFDLISDGQPTYEPAGGGG